MTDYSGDIAIVGMAGLYPDAPDIDRFWENILTRHDAVSEAAPDWLNGADMLDVNSSELLKIYTQRGGFLGDLARFDAHAFGTMPFSVVGAQPDQFLALKICHDALVDAGYAAGHHDHTRTGVILGHSVHVHRANTNGVQQFWFHAQMRELLRTLFPDIGPDKVQAAVQMMQDRLPRISSESIPGLVPNILSGRVANRLDLMGPNFVIDAACSSSLISADLAMTELREGRADLMLAGGVNTTTSPLVYGVFCGVEALSRSGTIRPFSAEANGTVLGEGAGAVVLKRLEDALSAEDRIYAVIKAVGQSSDGKSNGLMAPRLEGEVLAMERAYAQSGIDPASIGLIEAHGTGIPLGDRTEISAMRQVFGDRDGMVPTVPLGSVKSMIGHCIPAAGSASLIKNALALSRKILPPSLCGSVHPELGLEGTPFYISSETRPWLHSGHEPRRAAINAFGFGGVNAHMILEEPPTGLAPDATAAFLRPHRADRHSESVFVLAGQVAEDILTAASALAEAAAQVDAATFLDLSRQSWTATGPACLTIVAADPSDLTKKLQIVRRKLTKSPDASWQTRNGIYFEPAPVDGKVAFLFPGEMAQYPNLMQDVLMAVPQAGSWFDAVARPFDAVRDLKMRDVAFPPPNSLSDDDRAQLDAVLHQVDYGSELVFAADQAVYDLLRGLGITPDGMLGHSTGENAALVASGRLQMDRAATVDMIAGMNRAFAEVQASGEVPQGVLLTVAGLPRAAFLEAFARHEGLHFTMDNCPNQAIAFGPIETVDAFEADLVKDGAICTRLPISWGYHTDYVAPMAGKFGVLFHDLALQPSDVTLYSCATAAPFPKARAGFLKTALAQYVSRVRFTDAVERLYADGYRVFVECGPNATLTAFVRDILEGRSFLASSADNRRRGMVSQLRHLVAQLRSAGLGLPYPDMLNPAETPDQARRRAARAAHLKAPFLDNALPFVRFDAEEAQALRSLLGAGALPAPSQVAPPVVQEDKTASMHQHMGLMKGFLKSQESVAWAALGSPVQGGSAPAPGQPITFVNMAQCFDLPFLVYGYAMQGHPQADQLHPYLAPAEQDEAAEMAQRQGVWPGWALSRIAAKRAARDYLAQNGVALSDAQIEILKAPGGAPFLGMPSTGIAAPTVSLSHVETGAVACVAPPAWRIGVDYEDPARVHDPANLLQRVLSPWEQAHMPMAETPQTAALVCCIKEAAAKTLGTGFQGQPKAFQITALTPEQRCARVAHGSVNIDIRFAQIRVGLCALGFLATS